MLAKRSSAICLAAALIAATGLCPSYAATTSTSDAPPLTLEQIRAQRQSVIADLMVPSLKGIRGLAYVVITSDDSGKDLDKAMGAKLDQLKIPISPMRTMAPGFKPMDAIVEIKVHNASDGVLPIHLSVIQWCSLLREPKTKIRAVTYSDSLSAKPSNVKEVISELTNQFIINFLKAN